MKKCSDECTPCCDFCIYAYHAWFEWQAKNGEYFFERGGPIGCFIHYDEKRKRIAHCCGWCDDFYCFEQYARDVT